MRTRRRRRLERFLYPSVALVMIGASLIGTVAQSSATPKNWMGGNGPDFCANAPVGGGGYNLPASMHTPGGLVFACGPVPIDVSKKDTGPEIEPFWPITDQGGFQCTELAIRYLYVATKGVDYVNENTQGYWDGTGKHFVADVAAQFHLAVGGHFNGRASSSLPQVGDILSEMSSSGETYPAISEAGIKYGDVGIVKSVTPPTNNTKGSIELMVENNGQSGTNTITMHSRTSWSINSASGPYAGYYYTSFQWFDPLSTSTSGTAVSPPVRPIVLPSPPTNPVTMPSSNYQYATYSKLWLGEYSMPSASSKQVGVLPEGETVSVNCQESGASVKGSAVWDQLTNGDWVSDYYVDTPNIAVFSYPIPTCFMPRFWWNVVRGMGSFVERTGPSTSSPAVRTLRAGISVANVICQTSGSLVGTSHIWYELFDGSYVSKYYLQSAAHPGKVAPVPQCPYIIPAHSTTTTTTTTPIPTPTTPPTPGGAVTITGADGFQFGVMAGAPTKVTEYVNTGQKEIAPPDQDYFKVSVSVKNLQSDRGAPLFDLVNGGGGPGTSGDLSVFMGEPAGDLSKSDGWCEAYTGVYNPPAGYCADSQLDVVLPDGQDVNTASELSENPIVKVGGTITIATYLGPVPAGTSTSGFALLFGIGDGPKMVAVPLGK